MIYFDSDGKNLFVKVLEDSKDFDKERDLIFTLPKREAVYSKDEDFLYWKLPMSMISEVLGKFPGMLKATESGASAIAVWDLMNKPLVDLPREESLFESKNGRQLYPYQSDYVSISFKKKALLCSFAQGLGKTTASLVRAKSVGYKRLLIVCPKNVISNWTTEVRSIYKEEPLVFLGDKKRRENLREKVKESTIVLTNYEKLGELKTLTFDHVIVDEIQNLTNPGIKIYKDCFQLLRKNTPHIQGLSGTPIRLKVENLWGVLNLLDPVIAGNRLAFVKRYKKELSSAYIKDRRNGLVFNRRVSGRSGVQNAEELNQKLASIMYRVKRDNFVNFEEKVELIKVPMTDRQRKMYESVRDGLILEHQAGELNTSNVLTRMLRLIQVAEGSYHFGEEGSGKLDFVKDEIKEDKLIIWTRFKETCYQVQRAYPDKTVIYNSKVSDGLKKLSVWAFQGVKPEEEDEFWKLKKYYKDFKFNPGEAQLFVGTVNLRSGLGLNLQTADRCIFSSFDLNPNANHQAKDRIARIGQLSDEVSTKFLISIDTIEESVLKLVMENYNHTIKVLDGKEDFDFHLAKKLLRELVG